MKKNKWIKRLGILFAFIFLFIGTGCSSNVYDGDFCGNAKNPKSEFGQIRYTYIVDYLVEVNDLETETKYVYENGNIQAVAENENGEYLFEIHANCYQKDTDGISLKIRKDAVGNFIATQNEVTYNTNYLDQDGNKVANELPYSSSDAEKVTSATDKLKKVETLSAELIRKFKSTKADKDSVTGVASVYDRLSGYAKACFVVGDDLKDPGGSGVNLTSKSWGDAFKVGLFTGLVVYPMAWLLNNFVNWFGGSGFAQVIAILLVTLIIKLLVMALTFKGTMSTHKMQEIQPEIARIQAKYGNNKSPEARQQMGYEMMNIYKKYDIKPFAPFVSLLVTFPIFIGMYRAVSQTAILRTGKFLGITLGHTISSNIFGNFHVGALIIFILMAATQIVSMKLPNILNRKRMTYEAKKAQKQSQTMSNVFMVMILVMGFMMPATMSVYWIASAFVQILQNLIMHKINNASKKGRYKLKKKEVKYTIPQGTRTDS